MPLPVLHSGTSQHEVGEVLHLHVWRLIIHDNMHQMPRETCFISRQHCCTTIFPGSVLAGKRRRIDKDICCA